MRLQIVIDSATTEEMRELQQAYHEVMSDDLGSYSTDNPISVKVNGPECWSAKTPMIPEKAGGMVMAVYSDRLRAIRNP